MSSWINRTTLSGSSVDPNGTNSHTCTFTAATSGNLLVAVVSGAVTFTTPSGWTLLTSAVNIGGLYVFTKTASASESSFSTTHNASNNAIKGVVYEFPAGTSAIGSSSDTGMTEIDTGPQVSSLTGTYSRFSARGWVMANTNSSSSTVWTLPSVEDYDDYVPDGGASNDGVALSIAYDDNSSGSSFTPSSTMTASNTGGSGEGVSFALRVPAWRQRTALSGSSINANGTNSHTCTFTPATAGNFLVAIISGGVTSTTPSGWTLAVSAINSTGLYVFTKTASAGESSFSTTHNGSNYAILGTVYEFPSGTSLLNSNSATGMAYSTTVTGPQVTSLTGTYTRFAARSANINNVGGSISASCTWTLPSIEDFDDWWPQTTTDGVALSIAYDDSQSGSSFNPSSNYAAMNVFGDGEGVAFALSLPTYPPVTYLTIPHEQDAATSFGATLPSGIATGDLGLLTVQYNPGSATPSTPTGWSIIDTITVSASFAMRAYSRVMQAADSGDTLDFTHGTTGKTSHGGIILRGVNTSDIVYATYSNVTAATTHTNPTATASGPRVAVSFFGTRGSVAVTDISEPAGYTFVDDAYGSGGGATAIASGIIATPDADGSVGGGTWTMDQSQAGAAFTFALAPLSGPTPIAWII